MRLPAISTIVFWIIVAIIILWIVNNPEQAAGAVRNIGHFLSHAAHSLGIIASSL